METVNYVEFKKTRDLGSIITDTFNFIRENWKGYFGTVVRIAGPAFIIFILALGVYVWSIGGMMKNVSSNNPPVFDASIFLYVFIMMFAGLAFYVLMQMASLYYIKSYINNKGTVERSEIIADVKQNFWRFLGYGFLMILIVMIGTMLCVLPGIYVGIALSLGTSILVFENRSIGDTISYCFALIKDHWWETFGVVFVVGFLVWILSLAFSIPMVIYQMVKMATIISSQDPSAIMSIYSDPIYLVLMVFSYVGQFILSSITLISSVFIYYDLNEQKNLTGTIEKIDSIGNII